MKRSKGRISIVSLISLQQKPKINIPSDKSAIEVAEGGESLTATATPSVGLKKEQRKRLNESGQQQQQDIENLINSN